MDSLDTQIQIARGMLATEENSYPPLEDVAASVRRTGKIYDDAYGLIDAFRKAYEGKTPTTRALARMIDVLEGKPPGRTSSTTAWQRIVGLEKRGRVKRFTVKQRDGGKAQAETYTLISREILATDIHFQWSAGEVCFDCPCGEEELLIAEGGGGGVEVCECGRKYKLFHYVTVLAPPNM